MKQQLMNPLADNVFQMTNAELIGLAKNRFLDYETQVKIALNPYKRAHMYLIENPGLCSTSRDILWSKPGYVNKFDLVSMGHYKDQPEKYHELYDNYAEKAFVRNGGYRVFRAFLGGYSYGGHMSMIYAINHQEIKRVISISGGDLGIFGDLVKSNPNLRKGYSDFFQTIKKPDGPVDFEFDDPIQELIDNQEYFYLFQ